MKTTLIIAAGVAVALGAASPAQAQQRSHFGPQIGYNFDYEALVIGAQFSAPLGPQLELYPSFNYFFLDAGSAFAVNLDVKYRLPMENPNWLYLGGGLNVTRISNGGSSTDAALNLILGIESRRGNVHPFGEFRATLGDGTLLQLVGGLNFTLRGHE
jgi:hypothetical protein